MARPGEAALDAWSIVHVASGSVLAGLGMGPAWTLGVLVGFELFEAGMRRVKRHGRGLFEHESWPNVIADVVVGMLGWAAVWWLPWDGPLAGTLVGR